MTCPHGFFKNVEQWILLPETRLRYGLVSYCRFKDDMFYAIDSDRDIRRQLFEEIRTRADFFKVLVDAISSDCVQMIDLDISLNSKGRFSVGIYTKPTVQGACLSERSSHPDFVHTAWPMTRFQHFKSVCSNSVLCRSARIRFLLKLSRECPKHPSLQKLVRILHGVLESHGSRSKPDGTWLVFPYHPALARCHLNAVARACSPLFGEDRKLVPSISWRLGTPHLWRTLTKKQRYGNNM